MTQLSIAQDLEAAARPVIRSAFLVLEAAKPWSRETHHLFPSKARHRVVAWLKLGYILARSGRFAAAEEMALLDAWKAYVIPRLACRRSAQETALAKPLLARNRSGETAPAKPLRA